MMYRVIRDIDERPLWRFVWHALDVKNPGSFKWRYADAKARQGKRKAKTDCLDVGLFARPAVIEATALVVCWQCIQPYHFPWRKEARCNIDDRHVVPDGLDVDADAGVVTDSDYRGTGGVRNIEVQRY